MKCGKLSALNYRWSRTDDKKDSRLGYWVVRAQGPSASITVHAVYTCGDTNYEQIEPAHLILACR